MFSGFTRTPLWSAEYLTRDRVNLACAQSRHDVFHPDPNLSVDMRSELDDYAHSGFDRGHMSPSADMPTRTAQAESFSLANTAPPTACQQRGNLGKTRKRHEESSAQRARCLCRERPFVRGGEIKQLKARVMIPTGFYKAIYDATTRQTGVFITPNTEEQTSAVISIDDLVKRVGVDVFPELPPEVKSSKTAVITPAKRTDCVSTR